MGRGRECAGGVIKLSNGGEPVYRLVWYGLSGPWVSAEKWQGWPGLGLFGVQRIVAEKEALRRLETKRLTGPWDFEPRKYCARVYTVWRQRGKRGRGEKRHAERPGAGPRDLSRETKLDEERRRR